MNINKKTIPTLLLSILTTNVYAGKIDKDWDFNFEMYGLAVNIVGDSRIGDENKNTANVDLSTKEVLDVLKLGAMIHTEGLYKETWGYSFDYSFMSLGDSGQFKDFNNVNIDADVYQGVLEFKGFKRYQYDIGTVDYMAGVRWWDNNIEGHYERPSLRSKSISRNGELNVDWIDYVVGARYTTHFYKDWKYYVLGDIGFSKNTNYTAQLQTGVRYAFNEWADLHIGYKSIWVDYDNKENFSYNTTTHGAVVGIGLSF